MRGLVVDPSTRGGLVHHSFVLCTTLSDVADVTLLGVRPYELAAQTRRFVLLDRLRPWVTRRGGSLVVRIATAVFALAVVLRNWAVIVFVVRRRRPDVVHFQNVPTNHPSGIWFRPPFLDRIGLALVRRSGAAVVMMIHDVPLDGRTTGTSVLIRASDGVMSHRALDALDVPPYLPVAVVPHPPYDFIANLGTKRSSRLASRFDGSVRLVVHAGYIERYKGTDIVIEAFEHVARDVPDVRLIVAGEETEPAFAELCRSLVARSSVGDRIAYEPGFLDATELGALLAAASVVALPYRAVTKSAASGIAYAALACGARVVLSGEHFSDETFDEGRIEWVVNSDAVSVATAIEAALRRERTQATPAASWPALTEIVGLYEAAIARRRAADD